MKENLISTANMLCRYCTTRTSSKRHGGYLYFEDDKILIGLDTYVPNLNIYVKTDSGKQLVLMRPYHGHLQSYHPGKWENYIISLRELSLEGKEKYDRRQAELRAEEQKRKYGPAPESVNAVFD